MISVRRPLTALLATGALAALPIGLAGPASATSSITISGLNSLPNVSVELADCSSGACKGIEGPTTVSGVTSHTFATAVPAGHYAIVVIDNDDNYTTAEEVFDADGTTAVNEDASDQFKLKWRCTALPVVSGTPAVGQTMQTSGFTFANGTGAASYSYEWIGAAPDGTLEKSLQNGSSASYVVQPGDAGFRIAVEVTATGGGVDPGTCYGAGQSDLVPGTGRGGTTTTGPTFSLGALGKPHGKHKVGKKLTAPSVGTLPRGSSIGYQWYRVVKVHKHLKNKAIKGAKSSTYKLHKADRGAKVFVRLFVRVPGYKELPKDSGKVRIH